MRSLSLFKEDFRNLTLFKFSGNHFDFIAYIIVKGTIAKDGVLEDGEVIRRVRNGDTNAFRVIVERYHRHLLNFIFTLVRDRATVEDIGQEVFLCAYRSLDRFDEKRGTPFGAWLFTIARNQCMSELRQQGRRRRLLGEPCEGGAEAVAAPAPDGDDDVPDQERRRLLEDSVNQLPEPYRTVLIESCEGKRLREIARKYGLPAGTVKSRLFRARLWLRELIAARMGEE